MSYECENARAVDFSGLDDLHKYKDQPMSRSRDRRTHNGPPQRATCAVLDLGREGSAVTEELTSDLGLQGPHRAPASGHHCSVAQAFFPDWVTSRSTGAAEPTELPTDKQLPEFGDASELAAGAAAYFRLEYEVPPEPPTKPAIWYLRYLALVVAFGVLGGLTYDVCWRTNVCGVRAPYGTLEPEEQQGTKPSSAKSGLFYTVSTMVTTHALWAKTKAVAALQRVKKARSGDTDGLATQLECQLEDPVEEPQQGADSALPAEDEQEVAADGADGPLPAEDEPRAEDEQEAEDEQRGAEGQQEGDEVQREDDSAEQEGDGDQEEENSPQQEDDMAQQEENDDAQREEGAPHEVAETEA
ncbi:uncharacterized protein LOC119097353 [Pollicipes pollicipes]|uniref:uncharacterized protein LOC119097353 n=1 Tax=Pollicipes pollicipes TaxID=41117 RepID=UPI001885A078|nr:uncharacterized protein LOC119097353 [Pollicipes pollicipes]